MQEIINFVDSTYPKYMSDFMAGFEELELDDPTEPVRRDSVNQVKFDI